MLLESFIDLSAFQTLHGFPPPPPRPLPWAGAKGPRAAPTKEEQSPKVQVGPGCSQRERGVRYTVDRPLQSRLLALEASGPRPGKTRGWRRVRLLLLHLHKNKPNSGWIQTFVRLRPFKFGYNE